MPQKWKTAHAMENMTEYSLKMFAFFNISLWRSVCVALKNYVINLNVSDGVENRACSAYAHVRL